MILVPSRSLRHGCGCLWYAFDGGIFVVVEHTGEVYLDEGVPSDEMDDVFASRL